MTARTFFTDRNLGKKFPEILAAAGLAVERHADHFRHDCPDEEWLAEIGGRQWVAITHDARIRYKPNELSAVLRCNVALLVVEGVASHLDLARNFVATAVKIDRFLANHPPPFIAKIYRPTAAELVRNPRAHGRIEDWYR